MIDGKFLEFIRRKEFVKDARRLAVAFEPLTDAIIALPLAFEARKAATCGGKAANHEIVFNPVCNLCRFS